MASNWTQLTLAAMSLVLFLSIIPLGSAIRCYQCSSKFNSSASCAEPLPTKEPEPEHWARKYIVDCSDPRQLNVHLDNEVVAKGLKASFCRKQVQEIDGETRIVRSCGFVKAEKDCYSTANPPTKTFVCQCTTDLCNSALNVHSSMVLMMVCALIAMIRMY